MKKKILIFLAAFALLSFPVRADDINSTTYKIIDFSYNNTGSNQTSATNFKTLINLNNAPNDSRFSSTNYRIGAGAVNVWLANVPKIKCFETVSAGSTNCTASAVSGGMVHVCGQGGCFDKARFEIDTQNNPTDALYSMQISTDPSFAAYSYIDGSTLTLKSSHTINDYLTKTAWETPTFNVLGLTANTTYYLRATALHGNYTESDPGPTANATTGLPSITFDIDIADTTGFSAESAPPYAVSLGSIVSTASTTATNLIWMDIGTNVAAGVNVFAKSANSGLRSPSKSYTLASGNLNLDATSGYGLQKFTIAQTYLGPLTATSNFNNAGNIVGGVNNTGNGPNVFTTSSQPIYQGRGALYVKARSASTSPSANDYADVITFTVL